jgi:preprotein translocase subunit SecF
MRRLILLSVVIVAAVFVFGLYMGWFHVVSHSADGKSDITLTVDKDKIQQDKDKAAAKLQDLGHQAKDKAVATTQKAPDETASTVPPPPGQE